MTPLLGLPWSYFFRGMGGGRSVVCVPQDFSVRSVKAPTRCRFPRISFFVMTGLAFVSEVLGVEADVRVVAVVVVQPRLVVYDLSWFNSADLADPSVDCHPFVDVSLPCPLPRFCFIKLFLVHCLSAFRPGSRPPTSPASPMPAQQKRAAPLGCSSSCYHYIILKCAIQCHVSRGLYQCNRCNAFFPITLK